MYIERPVSKFIKEFSSTRQRLFQKALHLFEKVLSSFYRIIFTNWEKYFAPHTQFRPTKEAFFIEKTHFFKKKAENICRFKKKPYLCIAFETRDIGRLAQLVQSICLTSRGSAVRIRQRPPKTASLLRKKNFGRLAQLVQSICLTSRGSAVRIRQRPPKLKYPARGV